jgi:Cu-processing system ATP-binding protein
MKSGRIQAVGTVGSLREAMLLPLRFELRLAQGGEAALRHAVAGLAGVELRVERERAALHCERASKMAVLQALAGLESAVADLDIREPSLEDLFLGYSQ